MRRLFHIAAAAAAITFCASQALAHPGHEAGHTALAGLLHPLSGIDHILAMASVGLLAFLLGGRALWALPLAFVLMMAVGGALGANGFELAWMEQGIAASVLVLGALVAAALRLPLALAVVLVGAFAIFHGMAHGLEGAANGAIGSGYFLGFLVATMALHCAGIAAGAGLAAIERANRFQRAAGAAVGVTGLVMLAGLA